MFAVAHGYCPFLQKHTMTDRKNSPMDDALHPAEALPEVAEGATAAVPEEQPEPTAVDALAELVALRAKVAELTDQALRAQAEMQNVRRRADDEIAKARKFALESFAGSLLAVVDSLEAALAVENASTDQLREGTVATHSQLMSALGKNGITEINPAPGSKFDPAQEHAISTVADSGYDAGAIVAVLQKGYLIAERVLRPALVTVAASP
jgi:molecular chaperone GrpE